MVRIPKIRHMRRRAFNHLRNSSTADRTGMTDPAVFEDMKVPGDAKELSNIPTVVGGT